MSITPTILVKRLCSELKLKLVLMLVLNLWVYAPYYFLQWHHFFPPKVMRPGFLDTLVPFVDKAVWMYLSIDLLMPIGPYLMNKRQEIFRYALGIVLISAVADLIFSFWPTVCPRPEIAGTSAAYRTLAAIDNPFHAFPSLHAAFAAYSALCAGQVLRELGARAIWKAVIWLWALSILVATLLIKQHVIVDLAAGAALGLGVHACVFYRPLVPKPDMSYSSPVTKTTQSHPTAP